MRNSIRCLILAVALALAAPAAASAVPKHFENTIPIAMSQAGPASVYPSAIQASGVNGPVNRINVELRGFTHTNPRDVDILLVPPRGRPLPLMSDACGTDDLNSARLSFNDFGPPLGTSCFSSSYRPTDESIGEPDVWPNAPAGPYASALRDLYGEDGNGVWKLYVVDDNAGDNGTIANGWTLDLDTSAADLFVPAAPGGMGVAERYPDVRSVRGIDGVITDVNVVTGGLYHPRPDDVDTLLVGPHGQKVMLFSDACGTANPHQATWRFDDESNTTLTDDGLICPAGTYQPIDYEPGDRLPKPAPDIDYGTKLSEFDLTDPNGDWQLFVHDDTGGESGWFERPFDLQFQTRPKAAVGFAEGSLQVAEGQTGTLTLRRTGPDKLGAGSVTVTADGAGSDLKLSTAQVDFAADEREKTVSVDALADGGGEPAESFTVRIGAATGDAAPGEGATVAVTIPADTVQQPDTNGGGQADSPPPKPRCAGKEATIIGTPGADALRGTRGADVIVALGGNDVVKGAAGNDVVCAGPGNDRLDGDAGNDRLFGEAGRDRLTGGAGTDRLSGGAGRDTCVARGRDRSVCETRR